MAVFPYAFNTTYFAAQKTSNTSFIQIYKRFICFTKVTKYRKHYFFIYQNTEALAETAGSLRI